MKLITLFLQSVTEPLPDNAKFIAQDSNKRVCLFSEKPKILEFNEISYHASNSGAIQPGFYLDELADDWKTPLEVTDALRKAVELKLNESWSVYAGQKIEPLIPYDTWFYNFNENKLHLNTNKLGNELTWGLNKSHGITLLYRLNRIGPYVIGGPERTETNDTIKIRNDYGLTKPTRTAEDFLLNGASLLAERGKEYDAEKERSMGKTVQAFNTITGHNLKESEGWLLLQILKDVRQWSNPAYHKDSAEDCVSYSALKAEALEDGK